MRGAVLLLFACATGPTPVKCECTCMPPPQTWLNITPAPMPRLPSTPLLLMDGGLSFDGFIIPAGSSSYVGG